MSKPQRAVIYARISDDHHRGEEAGVQRQIDLCEAWADREGWTVAEVLIDNDLSASKVEVYRPAFERLLKGVDTGVYDGVLAWKQDRLERNGFDRARLIHTLQNVPVAVTNGSLALDTPEGRVQAEIIGALGAYEAARLGDRVKAEIDHSKKQGKYIGNGFPGYTKTDDRRLVRKEPEASHIRHAVDMLLAGGAKKDALEYLAGRVTLGRGGTKWTYQNLRTTMLSPTLAGLGIDSSNAGSGGNKIYHTRPLRDDRGDFVYVTDDEPIVTPEELQKLRHLFISTRRGAKKNKGKRIYLLSALLECHCGLKMYGSPRGYHCNLTNNTSKVERHGCGTSIQRPTVDDYIERRVRALLPQALERYADVVRRSLETTSERSGDQSIIVGLERRIFTVRERKEELIRENKWDRLEEVDRELDMLYSRLESEKDQLSEPARDPLMERLLRDPVGGYDKLPLAMKQKVITFTLPKIVVHPYDANGSFRFGSDRIELVFDSTE